MGILDRWLKRKKIYLFPGRAPDHIAILAMIRIRNESLIIEDTLEHLSSIADAIICYDDASTDSTLNIIKKYPKVIGIIHNRKWLEKPEDRIIRETSDRKELLELAKSFKPKWILSADADERFVGDIRTFLLGEESNELDLIRIRLFDAYLTPKDQEAYSRGQKLLGFRVLFGSERRDILMIWKAELEGIDYLLPDSREPQYPEGLRETTKFYCQHYGKSLSVEHWEETCNYYTKHFPYDTYGEKWERRKGKAIHTKSDFGNPLYPWGDQLFDNAIVIHGGLRDKGES
jgi:glycosyltransferase involved in cell wall biosynthesis